MNSAKTKFYFKVHGPGSSNMNIANELTRCNLKRTFTLEEALNSNLSRSIKWRLHALKHGTAIRYARWARGAYCISIILKPTAGSKKNLEAKKIKAEIKTIDNEIEALLIQKRALARKLNRIGG